MRLPKWLRPKSNTAASITSASPESTPAEDRRWQKFLNSSFRCGKCQELHEGMFEIAYDFPDVWEGSTERRENYEVADALEKGHDFLSEDFCLFGEHRFLRCVLPIPIRGTISTFCFGVWATINPKKFPWYLTQFDNHDQGQNEPVFSWLSNRLANADRKPARSKLYFQNNRQRPEIWIADEDHPFHSKQADGITFDELLDIYELYGHDVRMKLLDS